MKIVFYVAALLPLLHLLIASTDQDLEINHEPCEERGSREFKRFKCIDIYTTSRLIWNDAQDACRITFRPDLGSKLNKTKPIKPKKKFIPELVSIHNETELNTLAKLVKDTNTTFAWIGLSFKPNLQTWRWSDNTEVDYTPEKSGLFDDSEEGNCVGVMGSAHQDTHDTKWGSRNCNSEVAPFICMRNKFCLPGYGDIDDYRCLACPRGLYKKVPGAPCRFCEGEGVTTKSEGSTSCDACEVGYARTGIEGEHVTCEKCKGNTYSNTTDGSKCKDCGVDMKPINNHTDCESVCPTIKGVEMYAFKRYCFFVPGEEGTKREMQTKCRELSNDTSASIVTVYFRDLYRHFSAKFKKRNPWIGISIRYHSMEGTSCDQKMRGYLHYDDSGDDGALLYFPRQWYCFKMTNDGTMTQRPCNDKRPAICQTKQDSLSSFQ